LKIFRNLILLLLIGISGKLMAQKPLNPAINRGPKSTIQLIKADSLVVLSGDSQIRTFYGDVQFYHRGVYMNCRKAIHNSGTNNLVAYERIKINQGDTLTITGDTLYYDGNTRLANIYGRKVVLTDDEMTLTTKRMNYDLNTDLAYYSKPGLIEQDSIQLSSKTGYYNTSTKIFNYFGDVEILHPDFVLCTDSMDYDSNTKRADFETFTTINSPDGNLSASKGYYYTNTKKSKFFGRSLMENDQYTLEADTLDFNLETEEGFGIGHVAFFSKKDSIFLNGDYGEKIASKGFTKISGNTLMRSISSGDTLYLRADLILAYQNIEDAIPKDSIPMIDSLTISDSLMMDSLSDSPLVIEIDLNPDSLTMAEAIIDSTEKNEVDKMEFIIAYGDVKIFRQDFQSVCDSLNYNLIDSIITFIGKPMIWSDDNQLEGDTITTYMANNKIKTMYLNHNSFVIAMDTVKNFNQIKGRQIRATFDNETEIKQVDVEGNGESIYYAVDDLNKMIGLNRVECSKMRISFVNKKVKRIAFLGSPESKLIPPTEIGEKEQRLDNFSWEIEAKPSKSDIIGSNIATY
jgi:lipopolysaccharide assembly outer membrane protein LptD (OstA)